MGPSALNRGLLALALSLAVGLGADPRVEERARKTKRAENAVWQVLFGQRVVREAEKQLGRPYLWGAKDGDKGFDCSGLTAYVYGTLGVSLAPNALGQFNQGAPIERAGLMAGDLVFFAGQGSPLHVGIFGGDGRFIHAPGAGKSIRWAGIDDSYFRMRFVGARRVSPDLNEARRKKEATPTEEKAP